MFVFIIMYAYFIDISQGSVGRIYGVVGFTIIILLSCYHKLSAKCASERILKIGQ